MILFGVYMDLWNFDEWYFLFLVWWLGIVDKMVFVEIVFKCINMLNLEVVVFMGLWVGILVVGGIYDLNVLFYFYFLVCEGLYLVVLIGIWVILFVVNSYKKLLNLECDILLNVNVFGDFVLLVWFMGGREFDLIMKEYICYVFERDVFYVLMNEI